MSLSPIGVVIAFSEAVNRCADRCEMAQPIFRAKPPWARAAARRTLRSYQTWNRFHCFYFLLRCHSLIQFDCRCRRVNSFRNQPNTKVKDRTESCTFFCKACFISRTVNVLSSSRRTDTAPEAFTRRTMAAVSQERHAGGTMQSSELTTPRGDQ